MSEPQRFASGELHTGDCLEDAEHRTAEAEHRLRRALREDGDKTGTGETA